MAGHTSEKRWSNNKFGDSGIALLVRDAAVQTIDKLTAGENLYQDLLELWQFAGPTDQAVADQLFFDIWPTRVSDPIGNPGVFDTQANADEVIMVGDAKAAMVSIHELFDAMSNVVTATADRVATLRRMT